MFFTAKTNASVLAAASGFSRLKQVPVGINRHLNRTVSHRSLGVVNVFALFEFREPNIRRKSWNRTFSIGAAVTASANGFLTNPFGSSGRPSEV
jgi:hypothetical protein